MTTTTATCPQRNLLPEHYRNDGTCKCVNPARIIPPPPIPKPVESITVRAKHTDLAHPTTGDYVREWWLPTLGPTATLLLQLLARTVAGDPGDVRLATEELGCRVGCRGTGRNSALNRALGRLTMFANVTTEDGVYEVPSHMRTIDRRDLDRMTITMRAQHDALYGS